MQLTRLFPHLMLAALLATTTTSVSAVDDDSSPSPVYSNPPQPAPTPDDDSSPSPVYSTPPIVQPNPPRPAAPPPALARNALCSVNLDFQGFDVYNAKSSTPEGCYKKSRIDPVIITFTWTNYNGGTCWFKGPASTWKPSPGAISCRFDGQETKKIDSCDMPGNDAGSKPYKGGLTDAYFASLAINNSRMDCRQYCREQWGCYAVTWSDYNGGTCWLKNSPSTCKNNKGTYTTIVLKKWF